MSEQVSMPKRERVRMKLERIRTSRQNGMLGTSEIVALGGATLVLILVIISYLYFLVPARSNRDSARQERARLQTLLSSSKNVVEKGLTTEAAVNSITESLVNFESNQLFSRTQGRMNLYEELNQLIRKNGLRNTSGPSYTLLEPAGAKSNGTRSANTKWQSVYPGIAINLTVDGPYQNLRKFIRDIEASRQFLIINGIELERAENSSAAVIEGGAPVRSSLVSLRLQMSTYFQRSDAGDGNEVQSPER